MEIEDWRERAIELRAESEERRVKSQTSLRCGWWWVIGGDCLEIAQYAIKYYK